MIRVFWFKYIFPIKFKIRILDLMLMPKNSVPFEGQYYSSTETNAWKLKLVLGLNYRNGLRRYINEAMEGF